MLTIFAVPPSRHRVQVQVSRSTGSDARLLKTSPTSSSTNYGSRWPLLGTGFSHSINRLFTQPSDFSYRTNIQPPSAFPSRFCMPLPFGGIIPTISDRLVGSTRIARMSFAAMLTTQNVVSVLTSHACVLPRHTDRHNRASSLVSARPRRVANRQDRRQAGRLVLSPLHKADHGAIASR